MKGKSIKIFSMFLVLALGLTMLLSACGQPTPTTPGQTTTITPDVPTQTQGTATVTATTTTTSTSEPTTAPAETYKGRLSYHWAKTHVSAIMIEEWVEAVEAATDGRLKFEVYPNGQLYTNAESLMALSQHSVDVAGITDTPARTVDPMMDINGLWFWWAPEPEQNGYWHLRSTWNTEPGRMAMNKYMDKLNIWFVSWIPLGNVAIWSNKSLETLNDYKGLKIRVTSPEVGALLKSLGCNPVNIVTSEVYGALQQGMVDAYTTHATAAESYDWWAFSDYVYRPYVAYWDSRIGVNRDWWGELPSDIKQTILEVSESESERVTAGMTESMDALHQEFDSMSGDEDRQYPEQVWNALANAAEEHQWVIAEEEASPHPGLWEAAKDMRDNWDGTEYFLWDELVPTN